MALKQDNSRGYAALRERAAIVDRAGYGRILLTGADRRSYLQGLLTNDIEALAPGTGCYAAMLNAQGRMLTDMRVLELGDARPARRALACRRPRFAITSTISSSRRTSQVADVTASRVEFGLYGPRALDVLRAAGTEGAAPSRAFDVTRVRIGGADALLVATDGPAAGYDVIGAAADASAIRQALIAAGAERR